MTLTPFPSCLPKPRQGQENDHNQPGTSVSALLWLLDFTHYLRGVRFDQSAGITAVISLRQVCVREVWRKRKPSALFFQQFNCRLIVASSRLHANMPKEFLFSIFFELNNAGRSRKLVILRYECLYIYNGTFANTFILIFMLN